MSLLEGGVADFFAAAFAGLYLDAQLYRPVPFTDDGKGGGTGGGFSAGEAVKVQPDATTQAMRDSPGYVDTDKRYIMLASGHAEPNTDCELVAEGKRWSVVNWDKDPAASYFALHCRFLRNA
jgi:hypothetical protein